MKLRSQLLLFLFLFALAPLLAAIVINVPLIFAGLELFYHKAYLQNLRADFRDLDQHLASRRETVRLLAKFPEHEQLMVGPDKRGNDQARVRADYTNWINQVLYDQLDIIQILFLDRHGHPLFWLERDPETLELVKGSRLKDPPPESFVEAGLHLKPGEVLTGPIRFNNDPGVSDPTRFMMLQLVSPVVKTPGKGIPPEPAGRKLGAVVVNIDIGGLARAYQDTYWVRNNGDYLRNGAGADGGPSAFQDFPGLEDIFRRGELALWEKPGLGQVIWVPLFATEKQEPLWVGRRVDPSPITHIRRALEMRVGVVVLGLMVVVLLLARWIAMRAERLREDLTYGIRSMLEEEQAVLFSWGGPQELRSLAENLTRLAQNYSLRNEMLRAHARELEASNRYKSEFLANVSHELRTPLNSILLLSKLLAESRDCLDEEQQRQAQVIYSAGRDLTSLIDDILDLSRIEAGKSLISLQSMDVKDLLDELVELVHPQFNEKHLSLSVEVEPEAPRSIVSDREKLRQILKNFISNALKFTATGGVTLILARNNATDATTRPVRISVSDTGIGIPADKQALVFEAFKQADGSTSRRFGGTGLGLTISRQLAELMGGRIELESEPGQGAVFSLLLPLEFDRSGVSAEQLESRPPPRADAAAPVPSADFSGRNVLIVDDDVRNLLALTPLLERWGITVTGAGEGREALEVLVEEPGIDLVLMDIIMPGMDGLETIRHIRGEMDREALPIVVVTAKAGEQDRAEALAAGASAYVTKPVEPNLLKEVLERYLN